jgi:predicted flavoprotein YhiN
MQQQYAGSPIKPVALSYEGAHGQSYRRQGELVVSLSGLEGGLIYGCSALLREAIADNGPQTVHLDLLPSLSLDQVRQKLMQAPQRLSLSNKLTTSLKLSAVKVALIQESLKDEASTVSLKTIAERLKHYPIQLTGTGLLAEAISSAGGVKEVALDDWLMLKVKSGVFCVGEMLDWEAPTGGYLLTASLATARWGAQGVVSWLNRV